MSSAYTVMRNDQNQMTVPAKKACGGEATANGPPSALPTLKPFVRRNVSGSDRSVRRCKHSPHRKHRIAPRKDESLDDFRYLSNASMANLIRQLEDKLFQQKSVASVAAVCSLET